MFLVTPPCPTIAPTSLGIEISPYLALTMKTESIQKASFSNWSVWNSVSFNFHSARQQFWSFAKFERSLRRENLIHCNRWLSSWDILLWSSREFFKREQTWPRHVNKLCAYFFSIKTMTVRATIPFSAQEDKWIISLLKQITEKNLKQNQIQLLSLTHASHRSVVEKGLSFSFEKSYEFLPKLRTKDH